MSTRQRPTIVFVMSDQQRADTMAAHGYPHMITPALDELAGRGVSFTNCFAPGATCIASRAALFTGLYPHNTGVYSFNHWAHQHCWVQDLAAGGYFCANIGKMHVSPRDEAVGFHHRLVVENPTTDYRKSNEPEDAWGNHLNRHGATRPLDRHRSDAQWLSRHQGVAWHLAEHLHPDVFIGNEAVRFIEGYSEERPLFLQVGFTGPHEPYDPLPRHLAMYEGRPLPAPVFRDGELETKPRQHRAHQHFNEHIDHESRINLRNASAEAMAQMRQHYYAKVTTIDEQLGRVLDALRCRGLLDNALVIFTSDHGDNLGDHRLPYKWLMYDTITRVPCIVWDTDGAGGVTQSGLTSLMDLPPTIFARAGLTPPPHLEGASLLELLHGGNRTPASHVFCEDNYLTMVRGNRYKLVDYGASSTEGELYDLARDPHELENRFHDPAFASERCALQEAHRAWLCHSLYRTMGYRTRQPIYPRLLPEQTPYTHHWALSEPPPPLPETTNQ